MTIQPIKTKRLTAGIMAITELLDTYLQTMPERSVIAITSKVVSLCENRVVPTSKAIKEDLVRQEAEQYVPDPGNYGFYFTIANHTLIPSAGIDESNGDDNYILWPINPQQTANEVWRYLRSRFNRKHVGVVITDSVCTPLRRGTTGICLAHSGFCALNDYVGKPDLFDRPFVVSQSNTAGGLAAAAVLTMGEGTEQTPICLIEDLPLVQFQDHPPTDAELANLYVPTEEDIFAPLIEATPWQYGEKGNKGGQ
ncbi:MAG TPA: coenzyme F420-0:L-glutamate ligase [Candidatus Saccharimonadales bacterium]|nr:coenzyme F420-0:L-glutamate ligase [Candidatus Saccharimonadales bacterium]